jgi:hypothetical protein
VTKKRTEIVLPLILPIYLQGKPVRDVYRLVYVNALTVYYSFQHPIAFLSDNSFFIRPGFWERRRTRRAEHIAAILDDVDRQVPIQESLQICDAPAFFFDMYSELERRGISALGKPGVSDKKPGNGKRRVVL